MRRSRGQALVEFALILPIQLMLFLGAFTVYQASSIRDDLKRAASEGAIAGASEPGPPRRCIHALDVTDRVLGYHPTRQSCRREDDLLAVTLTEDLPIRIPFFPVSSWRIVVTERAAIR